MVRRCIFYFLTKASTEYFHVKVLSMDLFCVFLSLMVDVLNNEPHGGIFLKTIDRLALHSFGISIIHVFQ